MKTSFNDVFQKLLTNHQPYTGTNHYRKLVLLNVYLYLAFMTLLVFSVLHFFTLKNGNANIAVIDLLGALATAFAIWDLRVNHNHKRAALIGTLCLFIFFLAFFQINQNQSFGLVWSLFFPIFAIGINERKPGLYFTAAFYATLFYLAYQGLGTWQHGEWDGTSLMRLIIASLLITFVAYIIETTLLNAESLEKKAQNKLHKLSLIDDLTQVANRRKINEVLQIEMERANRHHTKLSIVLFDIDDFKKVNDRYGHLVGDEVLKKVASLVKRNVRKTDCIGRWGGEEFFLVLPEESAESASHLCEKLRSEIEQTRFANIQDSISCSFGVAEYFPGMASIEQFVQNADKALYQAKKTGKNRVIILDKEQHLAGRHA
ncbi:MAG: GGDEF domain-containing protein [Thiomicrorhabdus chilensis]|uniref:GGDEF domain-containing protein n=1 Tax=Thiomicrorhabdus chilensis TaxID=63656 RepID=UPI00299DFF51|nr:GGDEF domain-containing protein [Thiomicrorhabdus chilensis]MDX1348414.1 GGDEF domain-containing protein [Thiomicrorhabdus chilensis]